MRSRNWCKIYLIHSFIDYTPLPLLPLPAHAIVRSSVPLHARSYFFVICLARLCKSCSLVVTAFVAVYARAMRRSKAWSWLLIVFMAFITNSLGVHLEIRANREVSKGESPLAYATRCRNSEELGSVNARCFVTRSLWSCW